ncbi:MAG: PAS domain S-box protein [Planctomycetota bacterium]
MSKAKPSYAQLEKRLAAAEPIIEALKRQEVDAIVGEEKIAFLLLRKVEKAWLASSAEFSAMFNLGGIGMIQADAPALCITRVNPKFCKMTGYTSEELLTKSYLSLVGPEDRSTVMKKIARVLRGKADSWSVERHLVRKDGSVIWVCVNGTALRDDAGLMVSIMVMIEDISDRKQAEQQQRDTGSMGGRPSKGRAKPTVRKRAPIKKSRKSVRRSSSDKPRPPSR